MSEPLRYNLAEDSGLSQLHEALNEEQKVEGEEGVKVKVQVERFF